MIKQNEGYSASLEQMQAFFGTGRWRQNNSANLLPEQETKQAGLAIRISPG